MPAPKVEDECLRFIVFDDLSALSKLTVKVVERPDGLEEIPEEKVFINGNG